MNIKQAFLNYENKLKKIDIEEIGTSIYIKKWSGLDRARILPQITGIDELAEDQKYKEMFLGMAKIIRETALEKDGSKAFEDTQDDFNLLINSPGDIIQDIFEEIMSYNGMGEKEIKEAAKN